MKLRTIPPVCLLISFTRLFTGKLVFSHSFVGRTILTDQGEGFTVFRHVKTTDHAASRPGTVLLIRFKFNSLPDALNRFISRFPMLLITGFPGFRVKLYAVNRENGYWMGLYEWETPGALEAYRKSFVLGMMNKRAAADSVRYNVLPDTNIEEYMQAHVQQEGETHE